MRARAPSDPQYPVIANGVIEYPSDVRRCLDVTGASAGLFDGINKAEDETHMSPRDIFDRQFKFADEYMRLAYLYPLVKGSQGSFIYSRYYIVIWGRIRI